MEIWQDEKNSFLLIPLYWHGDDDGDGDAGEGGDADDNDDSGSGGDDPGDGAGKKPGKTKTAPPKPKGGDDDDDDGLPEDLDGLSAQELRDLLRVQGKELKRTKDTARKRLREIMEKKEKFKEIEAQKEAERIKELEEKEEYKKLYAELKPKYDVLAGDVGKTHTFLESRLAKLMKSVPEEYHKLIPDVDVRQKIAWIENFKETVVSKQATPPAGGDTPPLKKKAAAPVGNSGNPPEDPDKDKTDDRSTIEAAINNCKTPDELERLLAGLAKKGL